MVSASSIMPEIDINVDTFDFKEVVFGTKG